MAPRRATGLLTELLAIYPDAFGVPPRMERLHKVEAYLDHASARAVRTAIDLAWELQRR